jgi:glutathione S-transferase
VKEIVMSEFTVHSIPGSPFGRAVLATLEEKAASCRFSPVAPGTFRSPEHLARHPFGRVPVLEHNGFANVIVFHRVVGPRVMGLTPDEAAIEAAMPKARAVFEELARLLGEQPYFAGDAVSLADLLVAPQIGFFTQTPEWSMLVAPHKNLVVWLARMEARPSLKATTWERVSEMAKAA